MSGSLAGASFFYRAGDFPYQGQELRAFGLLVHDLVSRLEQSEDPLQSKGKVGQLQDVVQLCVGNNSNACERPTFCSVHARLTIILEQRH